METEGSGDKMAIAGAEYWKGPHCTEHPHSLYPSHKKYPFGVSKSLISLRQSWLSLNILKIMEINLSSHILDYSLGVQHKSPFPPILCGF